MADFELPDAMVEAAAEAEYAFDILPETRPWAQAHPRIQQGYRKRVRAGLLAVLAGCDVRERFDVRWPQDGGIVTDHLDSLADAQERQRLQSGATRAGRPDGVIRRWLRITTPYEEMPDA